MPQSCGHKVFSILAHGAHAVLVNVGCDVWEELSRLTHDASNRIHRILFKGCRPCRRPRKNGQVTKPNGHLTCLASLLQITPVGWWVYVDGILRRDQLASQHRKSFCPCWLTIRFPTFETKLLCYMTVISYIIWWSEFFPTIGRQFPAFSYFRDPTSQHHVLLILE